jgi:uncharacterized membrane protein
MSSPHRRAASARTELMVSFLIGAAVTVAVALLSDTELSLLIGWDAAAAAYVVWVWSAIWPLDAAHTAPLAERQDPTRATADVLLLTAAVASLVAVGLVLARASHARGTSELLLLGLGVASVVVSWLLVHTVFTLRYARLYYFGEDGGVNFHTDAPPDFHDFAYLAFTIGMTFQVSDTELQTKEFRRSALRQALLSYLFGTGILATTINLVASLTSR